MGYHNQKKRRRLSFLNNMGSSRLTALPLTAFSLPLNYSLSIATICFVIGFFLQAYLPRIGHCQLSDSGRTLPEGEERRGLPKISHIPNIIINGKYVQKKGPLAANSRVGWIVKNWLHCVLT